jgi:hypothetical protein
MIEFLWGATAMGCFSAGVFFLRFWLNARDRLFLLFALAFATLALNYVLLAAFRATDEARHLVYAVRLVAFGLIITGVVDKNRRT